MLQLQLEMSTEQNKFAGFTCRLCKANQLTVDWQTVALSMTDVTINKKKQDVPTFIMQCLDGRPEEVYKSCCG